MSNSTKIGDLDVWLETGLDLYMFYTWEIHLPYSLDFTLPLLVVQHLYSFMEWEGMCKLNSEFCFSIADSSKCIKDSCFNNGGLSRNVWAFTCEAL